MDRRAGCGYLIRFPWPSAGAMERKRHVKLALGALLLCALAAAEALAVAHWLDLESHAGAEPCKICISVAGLGTAAPAKAPPPAQPVAAVPAAAVTRATAGGAAVHRPSARAPPKLS